MFHLYFGAFDIVLYLSGIYAAMVLSNALCDQMDLEAAQSATTEAAVAPVQTATPRLITPATKREEVSVKVSVN
ncbi:MAG: hypothetical protein WBG38_08825 [Nodosilinea sp.]